MVYEEIKCFIFKFWKIFVYFLCDLEVILVKRSDLDYYMIGRLIMIMRYYGFDDMLFGCIT
jgi:hypothetical protein